MMIAAALLLTAAQQCAGLRSIDFSLTEDAPTEITAATAVEGVPGTCVVEGVVWPNVRFRVEFPLAGWNGKMLVVGSGGQAGTIMTPAGYDKLRLSGPPMLPRGYAFVGHDSGHSDAGTKWGWHNPAAQIDYGFRAGHVVAVIGKEVLRAFHGRRPARSYYHGCSNGGREALMMAQRYPWDYDGIVAGASSLAYSNLFIHFYAFVELMKDRSREGFDSHAAKVLHEAVLKQCDAFDGKKDGILEDPRRCNVDFKPILCQREAAEDCLTQRQADIARRIYEGPRRPDGSQIVPSSAMPGSELGWEVWLKLSAYPEEVLRYLAFDPAPGPGWQPDTAKLGDYARRMGLMDSLFSAGNPDLRQFKANGGKLLQYYGWNDFLGGVRENIDYYEMVERVMGGPEKTRDFYRLFVVPGMNHCVGGDGVSVFDFISVLDRWVEQGEAPDVLTGHHPRSDGSVEFTRDVPFHRAGASLHRRE
ncbi:MAG TPA: tannase/feruloyl esterase family alpha/beta hydrolase [Steroidobacteraceae bacterium]|nr:tannase/feruloyl esterase family alpha/beta hydrolase [Steroidobacteraceae bacterium]